MTTPEPISEWVEAACVPDRSLESAFVRVHTSLAAALASSHTRSFSVAAFETAFGPEQLTADVPNVEPEALDDLDEHGLIRVGARVRPGSVLVGKVTPKGESVLSPEEKLLRAIFGETAGDMRDTSLRCPPGCAGTVIEARTIAPQAKGEVARAEVVIAWDRALQIGDELLVESPAGTARVTVAGLSTGGHTLAWAGASGRVRVAKLSMVEDLIHARSIGPYSLVTQQPLAEREQFGGQRLAAPQLAALANVAPWAAWEMFTIKSDSISGRARAYEALVRRTDIELPGEGEPRAVSSGPSDMFSFFSQGDREDAEPGDVAAEVPESVEVLTRELAALGIAVRVTAPQIGARLLTREQLLARSYGAVKEPETLNDRTMVPEPDGLFCQRIFGPVRDYECGCGKYKRMKHRGIVCESCGVEVISSAVRRTRFGHVVLAEPVVHPLFKPFVARLLGISLAELEAAFSGAAGFDIDGQLRRSDELDVVTGGRAIQDALALVDDIAAKQFMLEVLPVLPPDLRPIVPLDGGRFATSDLNELYRRVINRNTRLRRLIELAAPVVIIRNEFAELQRTVDQLFYNERMGKLAEGPESVLLRSLAGLVEHRFGRLLERRVDYSGVTRFVVDPELPQGHCRLPRRMALELYKPIAYGIMEAQGHVATIKTAKLAIEQQLDYALAAIAEASREAPILLVNEAGLLAREVELWDEAAIAVDPSTARLLGAAAGLSAVTVHVPLGSRARDELANMPDIAGFERGAPAKVGGWLSAAMLEGDAIICVIGAALDGRSEAITDPLLRAALGRGPTDKPAPPPIEGPTPGQVDQADEYDDDF